MQHKRTNRLVPAALAGAVLALATGTAAAAPIVEDFSGYAVGTDLIHNNTGPWDTDTPSNTKGIVKTDPVDPGNQVGFFQRTGNPPTGGSYRDLGTHIISDGAMGEFSVRFLFDGRPTSVFGLSALPNPGSATQCCAGQQLNVAFRVEYNFDTGNIRLMYIKDQAHGIAEILATDLVKNTWYKVSATINNDTNTVTDIFLDGTLVGGGTYPFNDWATTDGDLQTFFVYEQGFTQGLYLDDIRVGETAVSPVPAPATVLLLAMGIGLILLARTHKSVQDGPRV